MPPSCRDIWNARAGRLWNFLCCPFVCTIGLVVRSIQIYLIPCFVIMVIRTGQCVHRYLCCCCGWPYEDDDFFGAKALGDFNKEDPSKPTGAQMNKDTIWLRAHELKQFHGKRPQLFEGKIEPADLCQGAVGDCWLVAAFSCAAEFPDFVRGRFVTREYNPRGLYHIRIYDPVPKKWVSIIVDDRIPCDKKTREPRFMCPNGNELWAIIYEKAYAKFCGSYAKLSGGMTLWGWHSMTGDHVFQMSRDVENDPKLWVREDMVPINDPEDRRACGFRTTKEKYTEQNVWTLLKKYDKQRALLSASIGKDADFDKKKNAKKGQSGEQLLEKEGLVAGHAYSIIQAREVHKFRLVQIRNPWGTFEWKGDWSDKSKLWKKHKDVAKKVGFQDSDDGTFWMAFEDFIEYYTRINICDRTTSSDIALDANEDKGSCGVFWGFFKGCFQYWCCCLGFRRLYFSHQSTDKTLDAQERGCCGCFR